MSPLLLLGRPPVLVDLDLPLAGVVGPHPVGDDHVAQRDLPPPPRAHAAHRQAADPVRRDELRGRAHGLDAAHAERLRDADPEHAAPCGHEGAHADLEPGGRGARLPARPGKGARVDGAYGGVLLPDRGDNQDVEALSRSSLPCAASPA